MRTRQRMLILIGLLSLLLTGGIVRAQQNDDPVAQALMQVVAASDPFADWLAQNPGYQFNAWGPDDNGSWYVEFYTEDWNEWLGYANILQETGEITDSFAPVPLPPDVYQTQLDRILPVVLADAEVRARLDGVPDIWDMYPDWNRWEQVWDVGFYRGIRGVVVKVTVDENDNVNINAIVDPNVLEAEEQADEQRNRAINLAYSAAGIDAALDGYDDWTALAEQQRGSVWSVTFASGDQALFFTLVDLDAEQVLTSEVPSYRDSSG